MQWYIQSIQKYADFKGRASRKEYWMTVFVQILITYGLLFIELVWDGEGILTLIYVYATLLPMIALSVRRLHDTGRSAGWAFITFIPFVGAIIFIVFMCLDSTSDNQYGPNPKR